jgi:hypothetical protein
MISLAILVPASARPTWATCIRETPIDMISESDVVPANRGRWTDIILVSGEGVPSQQTVFKTLAPQSIRVIEVNEDGPVRLDTSSYGLALSLGFSAQTLLSDGTPSTLPLSPTTGPAVVPAPGAPPVRWPGLDAHGLLSHPLIPCPAEWAGLDLAIDRADVWINGFPFTLPPPGAFLWCPLSEDPAVGRLFGHTDFAPLFGLPPDPARDLSRLLPLATVRAILRTVAPSLFLS